MLLAAMCLMGQFFSAIYVESDVVTISVNQLQFSPLTSEVMIKETREHFTKSFIFFLSFVKWN